VNCLRLDLFFFSGVVILFARCITCLLCLSILGSPFRYKVFPQNLHSAFKSMASSGFKNNMLCPWTTTSSWQFGSWDLISSSLATSSSSNECAEATLGAAHFSSELCSSTVGSSCPTFTWSSQSSSSEFFVTFANSGLSGEKCRMFCKMMYIKQKLVWRKEAETYRCSPECAIRVRILLNCFPDQSISSHRYPRFVISQFNAFQLQRVEVFNLQVKISNTKISWLDQKMISNMYAILSLWNNFMTKSYHEV
jgi:hypothetical protein